MAGPSLRAFLGLDISRFVQGTSRAGRAMSTLEGVVSAGGMRIAGALIVAGAGFSKYYAEVDRESRRTVALLDERNEAFLEKFMDQSREISRAQGVALKEVISASYQAFSLGKNWENYTEIMGTAIKATKTYGGTLNDNINMLLKFERVLGLSSEKIMDLAATTIQLGDTKLEFLSQYMTEVTGLTNSLKLPEEELFSLFAVGTVQQRDTMKVTTGLKALLGQFLRPESGLSKGLEKTFGMGFKEAIKQINFVDMLIAIEKKIGEEAFRGAIGANVDAANIALGFKELPNLYRDVLQKMENSTGKFAKDVEFALASPMERFERATAQLQDIKFTLGERAMPGIEMLVDALKEVVTRERIEAFISLGDALTKSIPTFSALAAALANAATFNVGGYSVLEMMLFGSLGARGGRGLGGMVGGGRHMARGVKAARGGAGAAAVASRAATGAAAGSMAGPYGALIGATVMTIAGGFLDAWGQRNMDEQTPIVLPHGSVVPSPSYGSLLQGTPAEDKARIDELARLKREVFENPSVSEEYKEKVASALYNGIKNSYNPMGIHVPKIYEYFRLDETALGGQLGYIRPLTEEGHEYLKTSQYATIDGVRTYVGAENMQRDGKPLPYYGNMLNPDGTPFDWEKHYPHWEGIYQDPTTGAVDFGDPTIIPEYEDWYDGVQGGTAAGLLDFHESDLERLLADEITATNANTEATQANTETQQDAIDMATDNRYTRGRYESFSFIQTRQSDATPWSRR